MKQLDNSGMAIRIPDWICGLICLLIVGSAGLAQTQEAQDQIEIHRASGKIVIDGDLSEPAWKDATRVDKFYETTPGDNVQPRIKTVGYLAYDDSSLYVGIDCYDPDPSAIRAPYSDRDNLTFDTDYAGIVLDTRHDKRTALKLLVNPRGVQEDSLQDDSNGTEDTSLDLFWDSAGKINDHGYSIEMRIPFSSLRYEGNGPQVWGATLYRNTNRDTRYRFFSNPLPRSSNCEICHERDLVGLDGLPAAGHITLAPYGTYAENGHPADEQNLDSRFVNENQGEAGGDIKWVPNANTAIDATINPDFSQVESDVAQISANNRFALFYPEKRSFFLEGLDLFSTPINAVYTRTITSPRWGARSTGRFGSSSYTLLATLDRGGGSVIIPGPQSSAFVDQNFSSFANLGRIRHDFGRSFMSLLFTDREAQENGYNRLLGPDFQWSPNDANRVTGQWLYSDSRTPDLPKLDPSWNGSRLSGYAGFGSWNHSSRKTDWYVEYDDISDEFRADDGFVPQVGYRRGLGRLFYKFYPSGFFSQITPLALEQITLDTEGNTLLQRFYPGIQFQGKKSVYSELDYIFTTERVSDKLIPRNYFSYYFEIVPSRTLGFTTIGGEWGDEIDYENGRPGRGGALTLTSHVQIKDHLELRFNEALAWVSVDRGDSEFSRLFTAGAHRIKATYNFTNRTFLRTIVQYVTTHRDPTLYLDPTVRRSDGALTASVLFAYKLNWQTVLFAGYGDARAENERYDLTRSDRQVFLKLSYAFQR